MRGLVVIALLFNWVLLRGRNRLVGLTPFFSFILLLFRNRFVFVFVFLLRGRCRCRFGCCFLIIFIFIFLFLFLFDFLRCVDGSSSSLAMRAIKKNRELKLILISITCYRSTLHFFINDIFLAFQIGCIQIHKHSFKKVSIAEDKTILFLFLLPPAKDFAWTEVISAENAG